MEYSLVHGRPACLGCAIVCVMMMSLFSEHDARSEYDASTVIQMQTSMQLADCMLFDSHLCTYRCMCNVYDLYVCCKRCLILGEAPRLWIRCCLSTTHMQYVILLARVAASSNFSLLG